MTTSTELRIPTQTFLLPGQEFCIGMPWERGSLPTHGVAAPAPKVAARLTLRGEHGKGDPLEGMEVGACTVLRRLSDGGARTLLAIRREPGVPATLVVLRKLELPEALAREVRTHAEWAERFEHEHLVRVFPCETTEEGVFWVTQLASGATLTELTAAMKKSGQALPIGLTLGAVIDVAKALGEMHSVGAGHGLVTDGAVAVGFDGRGRLHDTGLFRCLGQGGSWLELREAMAGYFAPEQLLAGRLPDPKSDVFSLGAVLYECLTGERVRKARSFDQHVLLAKEGTFLPASRFNLTIDATLDAVISRALDPDRGKRFANAREFGQALAVAAASFTWKAERRAEFVARHFEPRRREEASLQEQVSRMPTIPRPPTYESVSVPVVVPPTPRAVVHAFVAPPPRSSAPPMPVETSKQRKRRLALEAGSQRKTRLFAAAGFVVSLVVGFAVARAVAPVPEAPKPPPPPLVWLDDVSTEAAQVEVVEVARSLEEASFEPVLLDLPEVPVVKKAKVARKKRRGGDDVPVPPWLVSKRRR